MKVCSRCKKEKSLSLFGKDRTKKDGHSCHCLDCLNEAAEKYRRKMGREKGRTKRIHHRIIQGEELKYCSICDRWLSLSSFHKSKVTWDGLCSCCKSCAIQRTKDHFLRNIEKFRKYGRDYYWKNVEDCRARNRKNNARYYKENIDKIRSRIKDYRKRKIEESDMFLLNAAMSEGIRQSLRGNKKRRHWEDLVDYTIDDLRKHLEKQFLDGMSWNNYGRENDSWSIDHIRPISSFDFSDSDDKDFQDCWRLENLCPLWHLDNIRKGNRYPYKFD